MANLNLSTEYALQKGPLSDQEQLLKDLLLRETYYKVPNLLGGVTSGANAGVSTAPAGASTPPIVAQPGGTIALLETVRPGDLITADFMNDVVQTVNQIITYLRYQTNAASSAAPAAAPSPPQAGSGIIGILKDVTATVADAQDKVTITFPADKVDPGDFSDILVGNTRVDPGDLVKVDGGYSFKINKDAYTAGMDVRAVAKTGVAAQQVMTLFK